MRSNTVKSKFFLIGLIISVCILSGCSENSEIKSSYEIPFTFDDNFVAELKVPENTIYTGSSGELCMNFETTASKTEVEDFYENYFSDLQIVYSKGHASNEYTYYYDCEQRVIFSHLTIEDELNENNKTEFYIALDACEDISNNEYWAIKQ